jgi:hypothetical protein
MSYIIVLTEMRMTRRRLKLKMLIFQNTYSIFITILIIPIIKWEEYELKDSNRRNKSQKTKEEIIELYNSGKSTVEIALHANVSDRYIRMVLKDSNVEMIFIK